MKKFSTTVQLSLITAALALSAGYARAQTATPAAANDKRCEANSASRKNSRVTAAATIVIRERRNE